MTDRLTLIYLPLHTTTKQDYGIILNGLANVGAQPEQTVPGFLDRLRDLALPKLAKFNDQ